VQGVSENVLSVDTMGYPGKLKVISVVPEIKLVDCGKKTGLVIGLSVMCMMKFLILNWHFSQMMLILIPSNMLTEQRVLE
jgi:hypothetical protein